MILFLAHLTANGRATRGIHVRFIAPFGATIRCRIERLFDGAVYDFDPAVTGFSMTPGQPFGPTAEVGMGLYAMDFQAASAATFPSGDYSVSLHDSLIRNQAIAIHRATLV